jgi:transcriptional regulator with XRE-family HTH domain
MQDQLMTDAAAAFRENVQFAMEKKDLSVSELSRLSGIPRESISRILHGRENATIVRAEKIAHGLGKQLSELLKIPLKST